MINHSFRMGDSARLVDKELLKQVRNQECCVCQEPPPNDPHHVTSRGAGGSDLQSNVMPLCRKHHTEWETMGRVTFIKGYPGAREWLTSMGREDVLDKVKR